MQHVHNVFKVECYVALLYYFHSFACTSTKNIIEHLQISACKSFFSVIMVNALTKDQGLIQIKCLEKVQQIESPQCYTHGPPVTMTDVLLYISENVYHNLHGLQENLYQD